MTTEHMREAFERMPKDNKLSARYSDDRIDAYLAQPQFAGYTSFVAIIEQLRAERDEARQAALGQPRMSEDALRDIWSRIDSWDCSAGDDYITKSGVKTIVYRALLAKQPAQVDVEKVANECTQCHGTGVYIPTVYSVNFSEPPDRDYGDEDV